MVEGFGGSLGLFGLSGFEALKAFGIQASVRGV